MDTDVAPLPHLIMSNLHQKLMNQQEDETKDEEDTSNDGTHIPNKRTTLTYAPTIMSVFTHNNIIQGPLTSENYIVGCINNFC
jgi:hypothetical protein